MLSRSFPKIPDEKISILGFGCMRLPVIDGDSSKINEEEAIKMIRYAIDKGVNYIDTAYPYHKGNSEPLVAKALKDGYREKVYLATKHPIWLVEEYADFDKYLDEQLQKLETDHIDFYLLHALGKDRWAKIKDLGALEFLNKAKESGKIKYTGFSFHDDLPIFKEIIDAYDWDFTQIQLNYMDEEYQAGLEGMRYAAERKIGVIVMEPIRGGSLANNIPEDVMNIWNEAPIKRSPAAWALRYVWNYPEVVTVLSGMTTMEHVVENIETAKEAFPNSLTDEEMKIIERVKQVYLARTKVNCTECRYCMPCPAEVQIPRIFSMYNNASIYNNKKPAVNFYKRLTENSKHAEACVECGQCEEACPQKLPIRQLLKEAHAYFTEK